MTQSALITERGEPPGLLFIGRGEYSMTHLLSSPREEGHQGYSSLGEENTPLLNLLSSPREESYQGYSSSGEENTP